MNKVSNIFLFKLFISFSAIGLLNIDADSLLTKDEFFKVAKKAYKELKVERKEEARLEREHQIEKLDLCVGCLETKKLTFQVNKILHVLARDIDRADPSQRSIEKVESLDAMYHYVMDNSDSDQPKCFKFQDGFNRSFMQYNFARFDEESSDLIFDNSIPLSTVQSIHFRDNKRRIYFYRAAPPNRDTVVKIEVNGSEKAIVSYYKVKKDADFIRAEKNEKELKELASRSKPSKIEVSEWGLWDDDDTPNKSDYVNYGLGLRYEQKDYVPRSLTLIKGESLTPISELFSLKTKTEVSSKKVKSSLALTNERGKEYFEVEVDPKKAELIVPGKIDLFSSQYKLKSELVLNTDNEQKINFEVLGDKRHRNKISIINTTRGTAYSVESLHELSEGQTFSIQLRDDPDSEESIMLRYELRL
ncbi:hypothetical protein [Halobacteriovorax sp. HLS]|uniref:hypothetical protein n=1 Tax=Halobacteriovorax sp. HLS TaxID=2234000 RepID=UPI000FDAE596|nr:hypothetical protein [Halobacteriovorax sp. HLS]